MTKWLCVAICAATLAPAAGCQLYADDDCLETSDAWGGVRNPENGVCESWGSSCGDVAFRSLPDWGVCPSACEAMTEDQCLAAPGCRATYTECPPWADCDSAWLFNECWSIAPSGPADDREACESLDAYQCSRHNDCVAHYRDLEYYDFARTLDFVECAAEPVLGCYSDQECPQGWTCTAETECSDPPGCTPDGICPDVCYGHCVPPQGCTAVDCAPGYHCEEVCADCDPDSDPDCGGCQVQCVPDTNYCPIDCPPGSECVETCPVCDDPNQTCPPCEWTCVPTGGVCEGFTCPDGQHCEERCYPCDPLPDGTGCPEQPHCEPYCVPDPPDDCTGVDCGPGSHCEMQCTTEGDPPWMDECGPVCVPDGGSCGAMECGPGQHCEDVCYPPPPGCELDPNPEACMPVCGPECRPNLDPGDCDGIVLCDSIPPACPEGTVPGVRDGCWTGYCIPLWACEQPPPPSCESITEEAACIAEAACRPVYTGTCWLDPSGQWVCVDTVFVRCETAMTDPPPQP